MVYFLLCPNMLYLSGLTWKSEAKSHILSSSSRLRSQIKLKSTRSIVAFVVLRCYLPIYLLLIGSTFRDYIKSNVQYLYLNGLRVLQFSI